MKSLFSPSTHKSASIAGTSPFGDASKADAFPLENAIGPNDSPREGESKLDSSLHEDTPRIETPLATTVTTSSHEGASVQSSNPSVSRKPYDLEHLSVTMPVLYEYWDNQKRHDLIPDARPTFHDDDTVVSGLRVDADYLLDYYIRPNASAIVESVQSVDSITLPGEYLLAITGISDKLRGTKLVAFNVQPNATLRKMNHVTGTASPSL